MTDDHPLAAVEFIYHQAASYAKAKADRIYLDAFRKSKLAILMSQCAEKTAVAREQFALAHPDYIALLDGLRVAVETEETLRWRIVAAQARVDVWRTEQATNRALDRATQ
jgi:hypothetical protein